MYREFELPSNQSRRALAVLVAVTFLLTMALGRPSATNAVTTLASDAFTRTVATGWGNLDSGQAWLITNSNDASTDVNGSVGQMTHSAVGTNVSELKARVPTFNATDVDISAKFRAETLANDAPSSDTEFMLYSRYDAEPNFCCYYKLTLSFVVGAASPVLRVDKQNGTFTPDIGHASLPTTNNDPTVAWMLKMETVGNAVRGKAWLASTSEPASWQLDFTDSTNPVTGVGQANQFVVGTFTNDITPAMVIDVDDVLVTSAAGPDTTPPTVIARSPAPNATGVGLTPTVTAQFSEPVTGVSTGTMAVSNTSNFVNLAATVSYDSGTRTATLHPSSPLSPGARYRVGLSGGIKDLAGNPLAWTTWYFTTSSTTNYNPPASVTFKQGTHTGYQFNASGALTASKTFTLTGNSGALTTTRKAITNQSGMWLLISSGVWSGYWVRESSTTYVTANPIPLPAGANATFSPAKLLSFLKGTHTGYQFNGAGAMTAQKTFTLANNSGAPTTARSTKTAQYGKWFLVSSGVWAGYWVLSSDVVYLAP
jgi:Bacterial Ig-like domain